MVETRQQRKRHLADRNWAALDTNILSSIFSRLPYADLLRAESICWGWNSAVDLLKSRSASSVSQMPWLIFTPFSIKDDEVNQGENTGRFVDFEENKIYPFNDLAADEMNDGFSYCIGSSHDWLICLDAKTRPYLLNPFTSHRIDLPRMGFSLGVDQFCGTANSCYMKMVDGDRIGRVNFVRQCVLSSSPSLDRNYYLVIIYGKNLQKLAFCKDGDTAWTKLEYNPNDVYADINFHENQLYGLYYNVPEKDRNFWLRVWDMNQDGFILVRRIPILVEPYRSMPPMASLLFNSFYLVESLGNLLLVSRLVQYGDEITCPKPESSSKNHQGLGRYRTSQFDVFKVNFDESMCRMVTSLGGSALFVGRNRSISVDARRCKMLKQDCIYFTDDYQDDYRGEDDVDYSGHDSGVFSLKDNCFEWLYGNTMENRKSGPTWVVPQMKRLNCENKTSKLKNMKMRNEDEELSIPDMPWLIFTPQEYEVTAAEKTGRFVDIEENKIYPFNDLAVEKMNAGCFCIGSSYDWLICLDGKARPYLLNPFTSHKIDLPRMGLSLGVEGVYGIGNDCYMKMVGRNRIRRGTFVTKAVLSSSPSLDRNYYLVIIFGMDLHSAFCKDGDTSWTKLECYPNELNVDINFYENQLRGLYVANHRSLCIRIWDTNQDGFILVRKIVIFLERSGSMPPLASVLSLRFYLVESLENLLVVRRIVLYGDEITCPKPESSSENRQGLGRYRTSLFEVFKVDFDKNFGKIVTSLCGSALFLGKTRSISVDVRSCKMLKQDCIYFTDDYVGEDVVDYSGHDSGVFSLKDNCFECLYGNEMENRKSGPTWVVPQMKRLNFENKTRKLKNMKMKNEDEELSIPDMPWLIFTPQEEYEVTAAEKTGRFVDIEENKIYPFNDLAVEKMNAGCFCIGSSYDWLICLDGKALPYLLNPFTSHKIDLPRMGLSLGVEGVYGTGNDCYMKMVGRNRIRRGTFVTKAVLSSSPSLDKNYYLVIMYGKDLHSAFCKDGDTSWTKLEYYPNELNVDINFYENQLHGLYVASHDRSLCIRIWDTNQDGFILVKKIVIFLECSGSMPPMARVFSSRFYLVESLGNLLVVSRIVLYGDEISCPKPESSSENRQGLGRYRTSLFEVFKVDFDENFGRIVTSLRGSALFLGKTRSISVDVRSCKILKQDCIYFTDDYVGVDVVDYSGHDSGVFSLKDNCFECLYGNEMENRKSGPTWVVPPREATQLKSSARK